jgi:DNA-binding protein H-NS
LVCYEVCTIKISSHFTRKDNIGATSLFVQFSHRKQKRRNRKSKVESYDVNEYDHPWTTQDIGITYCALAA